MKTSKMLDFALVMVPLPLLVSSCGMTLHSEVAIKAQHLFSTEVENVSSILRRYPAALIAGAPFPDYLYACGTDHGAGEDAHWHTFHAKAAKYIREKYPNWQRGDEHGAKVVAFLLGAVSHYAADMNWHGQRVRLDNKTRHFGLGFLQFLGEIDYGCQGHLCQTAHSEGDTGGEFMIHHQLRSTGNIKPLEWFIPVADLVDIFHREPQAHPNVSSRWIIECGVEFRAAVEAVRFGGEVLFPKYATPGPFLQEQLLDFWIGGFDDMVHFSLVAWDKFLQWLLDGPPDPAPPIEGKESNWRRPGFRLRELLRLRPKYEEVLPLPRGAVQIGVPTGGVPLEDLRDFHESGLYGYEGTSVLFCDVDGDGELEEISGAPGWSLPGKPLLGQVLLRKPSAGTTIKLFAPNASVGGRFGHSLACGDFDGDGISDLAVSSPTTGLIDQVFERQAYSGQLAVFFGSTGGLSLNASWTATAVGSADVFGVALLAVASTSRKHRLAVGSPYFGRDDMEQMHPGMVHVFAPTRGGRVTPNEAEEAYVGWQPGEKFGSFICARGLDLFIGAPGHFAKGNSSTIAVGAIYSAKDGQLRSVMSGNHLHGRFGHSCAIVGSHLAVGQPGKTQKAFLGEDSHAGAVLLLDMTSAFTSNATLKGNEQELSSRKVWSRFGWSLASNGQYLAIGAPFEDDEKGSVHLYDHSNGDSFPIASGSDHGSTLSRMGWAISMSSAAILIGSPKAGVTMGGATQRLNLSEHMLPPALYA